MAKDDDELVACPVLVGAMAARSLPLEGDRCFI